MSWPKKIKILILIVFSLILAIACTWLFKEKHSQHQPQYHLLKHFSFSKQADLGEWNVKVLKGHVKYAIERFCNNTCVYAKSKENASALYYKIKIDIKKHPVLSWRWNVIKFPQKSKGESLTDSKEDDYGARVYVIFPSFFPGGAKALEYIWAEYAAKGTISSSPYSPNIKLVVLESGQNGRGKWVYEKRDLYEDYIAAFGKEPKAGIGAVAFMTDSDSTGTSAEAVYDEIKIEYKKGD